MYWHSKPVIWENVVLWWHVLRFANVLMKYNTRMLFNLLRASLILLPSLRLSCFFVVCFILLMLLCFIDLYLIINVVNFMCLHFSHLKSRKFDTALCVSSLELKRALLEKTLLVSWLIQWQLIKEYLNTAFIEAAVSSSQYMTMSKNIIKK